MKQFWRVAVILLALAGTGARATDEDDAMVLGALSDSPPRQVTVSGVPVFVYQFARNDLLRQAGQHHDVTYYYVAPMRLMRDAAGQVVVRTYASIQDPSREIAEIVLVPAPLDRGSVFQAMRAANIDPFLGEARLLPLMTHGLDVSLADLPRVTIEQANAAPLSEAVTARWVLPPGGAQRVRDALRQGASVQVGYYTLVKTSSVSTTRISWSQVLASRAYRDYSGPSGPTQLSAAQVVDLAHDVLSELNVFHWQEVSGNNGGATGADYGRYLQSIIDRVIDRRAAKEAALEDWLAPSRHAVPVADWQKMVDEVRSIAIDAKQLNSDEWCRKYREDVESIARRESSGDSGTSFGLQAIIPKLKIPIGFNFDQSDSDSDFSEDIYRRQLANEDCGKKVVEDAFKYEWNGVRYEPKSIFVYDRVDTRGSVSDSENVTVIELRQRLRRNEWSVQ